MKSVWYGINWVDIRLYTVNGACLVYMKASTKKRDFRAKSGGSGTFTWTLHDIRGVRSCKLDTYGIYINDLWKNIFLKKIRFFSMINLEPKKYFLTKSGKSRTQFKNIKITKITTMLDFFLSKNLFFLMKNLESNKYFFRKFQNFCDFKIFEFCGFRDFSENIFLFSRFFIEKKSFFRKKNIFS